MKKLLLLLAVAFSASLFACGGDKAAETTTDSTACDSACCTEAVAETDSCCANDSVAADTVVAEVAEVAAEA